MKILEKNNKIECGAGKEIEKSKFEIAFEVG